MKKALRKIVFETNSSSVHSIVISKDGLEPDHLPKDDDGYILAKFGQYNCSGVYTSQSDKLNYLITQCFYLNRWNKNLEDDYHFKYIEKAVCDYSNAKGIKIIGGEPEIDHQSLPEYELNFVNEYDEDSVQNFIFNKYITLECNWD